MISPQYRRPVNLALIGLCLVFTALLIRGFKAPGGALLTEQAGGRAVGAAQSRARATRTTIRSPHLFTPPAGSSTLPVTAPDMGITIVGVIQGPEESFILAQAGGANAGIQRVAVGGSLGPYVLREIKSEMVVFSKGMKGPKREVRWRKFKELPNGGDQAPPTGKYVRPPGSEPRRPGQRGWRSQEPLQTLKGPGPGPPPDAGGIFGQKPGERPLGPQGGAPFGEPPEPPAGVRMKRR